MHRQSGEHMTEDKIEIEQEEVETFTDELSDEALDQDEGGRFTQGACCYGRAGR